MSQQHLPVHNFCPVPNQKQSFQSLWSQHQCAMHTQKQTKHCARVVLRPICVGCEPTRCSMAALHSLGPEVVPARNGS